MSTVFLHVGQCGNQLGQAFWEEVSTPKWSGPYNPAGTTHSHGSKPQSSKMPAKKTTLPKTPMAAASAKAKGNHYVPLTLVDGRVPCVLVDAEPKVIRQCLDERHGSTLLARGVGKESCICDKTGRGNNWAYGYYGRGRGKGRSGCGDPDTLLARVQESVRKVVERCDRFSGFVMLHSIAGGTGSGSMKDILDCPLL